MYGYEWLTMTHKRELIEVAILNIISKTLDVTIHSRNLTNEKRNTSLTTR